MSEKEPEHRCPCEPGECLVGLCAIFVIGPIAGFLIRPEWMAQFEGWFLTALFAFLLFASRLVFWMSIERAREDADAKVDQLNEKVCSDSKLRRIDLYHDLGLPVWPIVYQWWIVAAVATAFALISLFALIAQRTDPDDLKAENRKEELKNESPTPPGQESVNGGPRPPGQ